MSNVVRLGSVREARAQVESKILRLLDEIADHEIELTGLAERARDATAVTDRYNKAKRELAELYRIAKAECFLSKEQITANATSVTNPPKRA